MNKIDNSKKNLNEKTIVPKHLCVIMDGNRRWAKYHKLPTFMGHQSGVKTVRMVIAESAKAGIPYLTLYAFSTENWKRSKKEINYLIHLFQDVISKEKDDLIKNDIKVKFIGNLASFPKPLTKAVHNLELATINNKRVMVNIAINYGGRAEINHAFQCIIKQIKRGNLKTEAISPDIISQYLFTKGLPDPDLLIRTGGEKRVSNFLLWQIAYTELWFTKTFWPDFNKEEFWKAIYDFQKRVRKFGGEI